MNEPSLAPERVAPFGIAGRCDNGRLDLSVSPPLKKFVAYDQRNHRVGVVYGCVLEHFCGPGITISHEAINLDFQVLSIGAFEQLVLGINGSFVAETCYPLPHRLYPDSGCTIPVVYSKVDRSVASSASMLLSDEEYESKFLTARHARLVGREIDGAWIPGFLTAHLDVCRLLPNFYLDLETWEVCRFWPTASVLAEELSLEEAANLFSSCLSGYVLAVAKQFESVAPTLTAGFDTRAILAACRGAHSEQLSFVTMGNQGQSIDQAIACDLASSLGINHRLLPVQEATPAEIREWDYLVGHCTREVSRSTHPTLKQVQADVMLTGMFGETGRSRLYKAEMDKINEYQVSAGFVAGRIGVSRGDQEVLSTLDCWVNSIKDAPTSKVLDLAFNELRFGGWAMAQAPIQRALQFTLMPMAQFRIQEAFMNTKPSIKTSSNLFTAACGQLWPEAMSLGVNEYGDYRDQVRFFQKFFRRDQLTRGLRLVSTRWGRRLR